jgi:hypothetical protein
VELVVMLVVERPLVVDWLVVVEDDEVVVLDA